MKEYVIIVAGGSGSRMKSDIPKQFIPINKLPVLMHTILAFRSYSSDLEIVLVLPAEQFQFWKDLCREYGFLEKYVLVEGGDTRFHSVKNGLNAIPGINALVAVHDGVRPVITKEIISKGFETAKKLGTAVVSVSSKDSIRSVHSDGTNFALQRDTIRMIQTPQTFQLEWMKKAFGQPFNNLFTDCASVLESAGYPINLIEGSYKNIKITTPEDLKWAENYLKPISIDCKE